MTGRADLIHARRHPGDSVTGLPASEIFMHYCGARKTILRDVRMDSTAFQAHPPLLRGWVKTRCMHRYCALQHLSRPKMWRPCNVLG
jgi:hypothetical protein